MKVIFEDKDLEELLDTGQNRKYKKYARDPEFMRNLKLVMKYMYTLKTTSELSNIGRLNYKKLQYEYKGQSSVRVMYNRVERLLFEEYENGIKINVLQLDDTHYGIMLMHNREYLLKNNYFMSQTRGEGYMVMYEATPPGEILESELEYRGISLVDFCIDARVDLNFLQEFIKGEHPVTDELAKKFEELLGIDAYIWHNLQRDYEYDTMVLAERAKNKQQKKQDSFFNTLGKVAVL